MASLNPVFFMEIPAIKKNDIPNVRKIENDNPFISFFIRIKINKYANIC
jgi:hypothetical protein